ncbi:MAG: methyl-accepting chemotaxis protein [Pseudomonadota bacterium]
MAEINRAAIDSRRNFTLLGIAIALIVVAIGGFYYYQSTSSRNQTWIALVRSINANVTSVAKAGSDAAFGIVPDFRLIADNTNDFDDTIKALREGDSDAGIKKMPSNVQAEVDAVANAWKKMHGGIDKVLKGEVSYQRTLTNISTISTAATSISKTYGDIADRLNQQGGAAALIVANQIARLERMQAAAQRVVHQGRDAEVAAAEVDKEVKAFLRGQRSISIDGSTDKQINDTFSAVPAAAEGIVNDAPEIAKLQQSAAVLQGDSTEVLAAGNTLEQALLDTLSIPKALPYISLGASGLALVLIIAFVYLSMKALRERNSRTEERDAKQQQAILGLLDEITNLADGDLTVDVTVTEDFTGAIADSFNYTVGNMRNLVGTINTTSVDIGAAASETQQVALKMNEASERQAREISAVTNTIAATSQSLQQVAASAEKLAAQAQNSVQVAHNGAETVGRTIQGMAALREQIQDTSKRIKRLGESSQEIGNIIEFINDIAEQTNTLALNASIQAAMAGEQGRGFAVVADEVQRLAERAANATRQIENLVKTIQADTNEAIISMERSTTNVVSGAKSAEEAGQALTKIETSSQELSRLIQEISVSARSQSAASTKIAGTMQVIREIAVQTSGSAGQTANAVGELNTLSEKLRESVAGFKLP